MEKNNHTILKSTYSKKCFHQTSCLKKLLTKILLILCICLICSCEDFLEIDAPDAFLVGETVFEGNASAEAALVNIYSSINEGRMITGSTSMTLFGGLASDELMNYNTYDENYLQFFDNNIGEENIRLSVIWRELYQVIYASNRVIEGLENSKSINEEVSLQLEGEARFLRAFAYFLLVNLWGDVPLVLTTDHTTNALLPRTTVSEVYAQIIADLKEARKLLPEDYVTNPSRTRANKAVATALLSRTYLYTEDWSNAEAEATSLINNATYKLEDNVNDVFLVDSEEAILQLQNGSSFFATYEGQTFILTRAPRTVALREELVYAFDDADKRLIDWVGSISTGGQTYYYPFKYKIRYLSGPPTEYLTLFRLAEQYLIRAEARAQQGETADARADLNMIRARAGLTDITSDDQASLLLAIEEERRLEFFTEMGHRWFDLNRTGRNSTVLGSGSPPLKPGWKETDALWPIPVKEILNNPNLTQNPGY